MGNCQKAFDKIKQYLQNPSTFGKEGQPIYFTAEKTLNGVASESSIIQLSG